MFEIGSKLSVIALISALTGSVALYSFSQNFGGGRAVKQKQGSYGKVKVHEKSLLSLLLSPQKLINVYKFYNVKKELNDKGSFKQYLSSKISGSEIEKDIEFCEEMLGKVSRSFALVIKFLPNEAPQHLRVAVGVFYLVLRVLDTVEDEMDISKFVKLLESQNKGSAVTMKEAKLFKRNLLLDLHKRLDRIKEGTAGMILENIGDGDELYLLNNFEKVISVYELLPKEERNIISSIAKQMGFGMSEYIGRNLENGTDDEKDFFTYCHYVAGLVGDGLTKLFIENSMIELKSEKDMELFESMGQFLQRTNIIRDYLEDYVDQRAFWPRSLWKQHVPAELKTLPENLGIFAEEDVIRSGASVNCLNDMICNALVFLPDIFEYLSKIKNERVFAFCAVPQVMAIRTLEECFNNKKLFTGVVKISKADSATILLGLMPAELRDGIDNSSNKEWLPESSSIYKACISMLKESAARISNEAKKIQNDPISIKISKICDDAISRID